ncbi:MAG: adenosylcobinamide-phosphate synthase CbiB [Thermoleophilia bacterium]|nr:adenosylcobinamide-phosphate synthase CbiB [Thermoleophilia bacterium]
MRVNVELELTQRTRLILVSLAVDALLGDPRWFPHPAKLTGRLALRLEALTRKHIANERLAGFATATAVILSSGLVTFACTRAARLIHPRLGQAAQILVFWTAIAPRDLADHALAVHRALVRGDLDAARTLVGRMVGRDVAELGPPEVVRAAVESVAENTVDGVTSPLFYAFVGGPVGAAVFKAISTLDSTFGYRNERYLKFGWASARADDIANYIPARGSLGAFVLAAAVLRRRARRALQVALRDGSKHASPNSGLAEAAMAGALGVQLGGPLKRGGETIQLPTLGDPDHPLEPGHIRQAVALMAATTVVWTALLCMGTRVLARLM